MVPTRRASLRPRIGARAGGVTMARKWPGEERLTWKLVGKGSRRGSTLPGRASDITRRPLFWVGVSAALALSGPRGRRAALRGGGCYVTAGLIHLLFKPIVGRSHPRGGALMQMGFGTSSFPSGHAATDPVVRLWRVAGAAAAVRPAVRRQPRRSLGTDPRPRAPPTDVFFGGALGIAVAVAAWGLWPPRGAGTEERNPTR